MQGARVFRINMGAERDSVSVALSLSLSLSLIHDHNIGLQNIEQGENGVSFDYIFFICPDLSFSSLALDLCSVCCAVCIFPLPISVKVI
jgi:hypothetical protein